MKTYEAHDWGSDTLKACRDLLSARDHGADIVIHIGDIDVENDRHLRTISKACVESDIELVLRGFPDPEVVYPHITFIEDDEE